MSKINRHPVRRTAAGVLASALVLSGAVAAAVPAQAATGFQLDRIAGDNRYETSALTVAAFGQANGAILASGENGRTPDALAANFLAGMRNVPVALTTQNRVTAEVLAALHGLGGENITVVGGTAAVSEDVVTQLRGEGFTVDRVFCANRYETAREIVEAGESPEASNIGLVASGTSTIDALAGGPLSFAGKHPMFLVTRDGIPEATLEAIRISGVTSVFVLGGEAAVGPGVVAQLAAAGVTVRERLFGDNRSETSVAIANRLIADFGFSATTFNLASGLNEGVDALGAAALSGRERRVLLVTQNASTAPAITGFATTNTTRLTTAGHVFGGPAAISTTFEAAVETAGVGTVAPDPVALESATVVQGAALTGTITGDFSAVTVSGCGFTDQAVTVGANGAFTLDVGAAQATGECNVVFTLAPTGGGAAITQTVAVTVTAAPDPALITDARSVADNEVVGVGTNDQFAVAFDQDVDAATLAATTFNLTDEDGDLIQISGAPVAAGDFLTSATYELILEGQALRITLEEDAEDANTEGGGGITLPLRITAVGGLQTAGGDTVDLANSTDLVIDVE